MRYRRTEGAFTFGFLACSLFPHPSFPDIRPGTLATGWPDAGLACQSPSGVLCNDLGRKIFSYSWSGPFGAAHGQLSQHVRRVSRTKPRQRPA